MSDLNTPLDRSKVFGDNPASLRDKSRATLAYYCSRSDLKSSSSLSSVNPGRASLGNPVFSTDNMSKNSESKGTLQGAPHPMRTNTVSPKECPTKKNNSWCRDQPLARKTISQPLIPNNLASHLDSNSQSLHFINFKTIDDDDYDEVEISTQNRLEARHVMQDNYSTLNDESVSLLPQQAQDKTEEDNRKRSAEVLSSSSYQLQSQSSVTPAKSKWNKIRHTVKMAGAFSPTYRKKGVLEREDSFLKRFSTRQGGTKEAQTDDLSGSTALQPGDHTVEIHVPSSQ